jgi:four helix bundle protein
MKYGRFEDLPVWKEAIKLAEVYELTENECFKGKGSLKDQLERAAVSVSNNIAEGFERGTTQELLTFIYIARGSVAEVRSMFHLIDRIPVFSNLKSQISNLRFLSESISRQLRGWADSLQNSDIKGQRTSRRRQDVKTGVRKSMRNFWPSCVVFALMNRNNHCNQISNFKFQISFRRAPNATDPPPC